MSRVADTASHSTLLNNLNRSIERARDIQVQVSTGKVGLDTHPLAAIRSALYRWKPNGPAPTISSTAIASSICASRRWRASWRKLQNLRQTPGPSW